MASGSNDEPTDAFDPVEAVRDADLLLVSVRRRVLPADQMALGGMFSPNVMRMSEATGA